MFFIKRKDGQVVSFSEERPASVSDAHIIEEVDVNPAEIEDIKQAKQVRIEHGKLVTIPNEIDTSSEIQELLEKLLKGTATKDDKDKALIILLQKT